MKKVTRFVALLMACVLLLGMLPACGKLAEDDTFATRGQFYALFVQEKGLYSDVYTSEEIENSKDYKADAAVMLEWGLIDEAQCKSLNKPATKDLVAQVCVRFMAFRQTCSDVQVKDIVKCCDQQAIRDAVGMGIFELSNGYFDANERMAFEDCLTAMERADEVDANTEFDQELEIEYQDNVESLNGEDILDFVIEEADADDEAQGMASDSDAGGKIIRLAGGTSADSAVKLVNNSSLFSLTTARISILRAEYDRNRDKYQIGKILTFDPYQSPILGTHNFSGQFAGKIVKVQELGAGVTIYMEQCPLEDIVKDTDGINKRATTRSQTIRDHDVEPDKKAVKEGFQIKKTESGKGVTVTFKHTFTLEDELYTKQTWRNPKAKPSVTITATVDDFKITTENLGKLLFKDEKCDASIALSFDTSVSVEAETGSLRYSPDNNGNGKFLSNLSRSRWTGASAGGSKSIKVGKVIIPLANTGFSIECGLYLYVQMDGSISVQVTSENCYALTVKNGKPVVNDKSTQPELSKAEVKANITAGVNPKPAISFWRWKLIDADVKAGADLYTTASLYEKDDQLVAGDVVATGEDMEAQSQYQYCLDAALYGSFSGHLLTKDSVVGKIVIGWGLKTPSFKKHPYITGFHYEDGKFVEECTRGKVTRSAGAEKDEINSEQAIYLESYKESLPMGTCVMVLVTSMPMNDQGIKKVGGVTVSSGNEDVVTATYIESRKAIVLSSVGVGSTEVTIRVPTKRGSKDYIEQQISVTVVENAAPAAFTPEGWTDNLWDQWLYGQEEAYWL